VTWWTMFSESSVVEALEKDLLVEGAGGGRRPTAHVDALASAAAVQAEVAHAEVGDVQRRSGRILADRRPAVRVESIAAVPVIRTGSAGTVVDALPNHVLGQKEVIHQHTMFGGAVLIHQIV